MTNKSFFIFIFLCGLFLTEALQASPVADSLYLLQNYRMAALEYERIIAFSTDGAEINNARFKKALCYKKMRMYEKAQLEMLKLTYWNISDTLAMSYRYETALCSYLAGSFTDALFQIDQMEQNSQIKTFASSLWLIKTLSYTELKQWEKAREAAILYVTVTYDKDQVAVLIPQIQKLYSRQNLPKFKSEKKANVLRMVPGLGQMYAGGAGEGAVNFALNLAFLGFGAYEIIEGFYFTGYFIGAIGLNKVYFGGHTRTAYLLGRNNYEQQQQFSEKVKKLLINKKAGF